MCTLCQGYIEKGDTLVSVDAVLEDILFLRSGKAFLSVVQSDEMTILLLKGKVCFEYAP